VKSVVEKWLQRQKVGAIFGNLTAGVVMAMLAVPLTLLTLFVFWMLVRVAKGENPLSEIFGRGRLVMDNSILIALLLFIGLFLIYLIWARRREERSRRAEDKEDDPAILDIPLIFLQILFAAPAVVVTAFGFWGNILVWSRLNEANCAAVLTKLLGSQHRVALEVLKQELPDMDWEAMLQQLRLIPGVVFLNSRPAGLSLTSELRQTFTRQRWSERDWKPPPREERIEFPCRRCGQRLRIRRFQINQPIRCPQCHARYQCRLDLHGGVRIEPEPERRRSGRVKETIVDLSVHYRTLELPKDADLTVVRRAYRQMMKQYHPDLYAMAEASKRAQAEEKAKQINEAYHALLDHLEGKG